MLSSASAKKPTTDAKAEKATLRSVPSFVPSPLPNALPFLQGAELSKDVPFASGHPKTAAELFPSSRKLVKKNWNAAPEGGEDQHILG